LKIKIIQVDKTKTREFQSLIDYYSKLISPFVDLSVINIKKSDVNEREKIKNEEGEKLLKQINENDFVIVLDENGKNLNSIKFSEFLRNKIEGGFGEIIFVIGGAFGLSENVKKRANFLLSCSEMTFTHEMIRVILLEQIYRGLMIMKGRKYHY